MKLQDIYRQYVSGKLDKYEYIDSMYKKHQILFEYFDYIKQTDVESITIANDLIYLTVKGSGLKLLLDPDDRRFIPIEMMNFHSFDPEEKEILFKIAEKCKTVCDIGANIGWYTLNFAQLPKIKQIYSFEPIPHSYSYLQKHLKLNNIKNVSTFNCALSDKIGTETFYWTEKENGSASMKNIQERANINQITCELNTLDNFMKRKRTPIDLIKCDVEGSELFVFRGGIKTIKKDKPVVFTEMLRKWSNKFDYHPNDIICFFAELGYGCYIFKRNKLKKIKLVTDCTLETNFLFLNTDKHKKIISTMS